jgi:hypothetical protein
MTEPQARPGGQQLLGMQGAFENYDPPQCFAPENSYLALRPVEGREGLTCCLAKGSFESFDSALMVLNSFVAVRKQRLESADLSEKAAANLESEFCDVSKQ